MSNKTLWANSVFELRDAYKALRAAIGEHPDRETLVRRYEEIYAGLQQERERGADSRLEEWRGSRKPLTKPRDAKKSREAAK